MGLDITRIRDDILLCIFETVSVVHRRRLSRVCRKWKSLIGITLQWVNTFSAVDDRRCVTDWEPSNWISIKFASKHDYIRIPRTSASELLSHLAPQLQNLRAIDLECCDMNTRILRSVLNNCKKIERLNLDSSSKLNYYSFNLMTREWPRLRHLNISCCTEVTELSASLLIKSLTDLESLNICGTRIMGKCLEGLSINTKRLDISYCWGVQEQGLMALSRAKCTQLEELVVNNFDFDGSESCLVAICNNFKQLKHLQMSIGPCVAQDYFIDRITARGFCALAKLKFLETLIIEKICVLENTSLITIFKNCHRLKVVKLNLSWQNLCTELAFVDLNKWCPEIEELHIMYPSSLKVNGLKGLSQLKKLRTLSIVNAPIDNEIFKVVEASQSIACINFDQCRRISLRGLNHLCRIASKKPHLRFTASLLATGIAISRLKSKKNIPANLSGQASNVRSTKVVEMFGC